MASPPTKIVAVAFVLLSLLALTQAVSKCWPGSDRKSLSAGPDWPERFQLTALAYQPELNALVALTDNGKMLILNADDGSFLLFLDLNTNNDWEGADWIDPRTLALVAQNPADLAIFDIVSETLVTKHILGMPSYSYYNGAEGLAVVPGPNGLSYAYVANSADGNIYIYEFTADLLRSPNVTSLSPCGTVHVSWLTNNMTDMTDISYDPDTATLWLLYDKDNRVVRLSVWNNSLPTCENAGEAWSMSANFPLNDHTHQTGIAVYGQGKTMAIGNYGPDRASDQLGVYHLKAVPVQEVECGYCSTNYDCPSTEPETCDTPGFYWSCVNRDCWVHLKNAAECTECDTIQDCPPSVHSSCSTKGVQYKCTPDRKCESELIKGVCDNSRAFAIIAIIIAGVCIAGIIIAIYLLQYHAKGKGDDEHKAAEHVTTDPDGPLGAPPAEHLEGFSNTVESPHAPTAVSDAARYAAFASSSPAPTAAPAPAPSAGLASSSYAAPAPVSGYSAAPVSSYSAAPVSSYSAAPVSNYSAPSSNYSASSSAATPAVRTSRPTIELPTYTSPSPSPMATPSPYLTPDDRATSNTSLLHKDKDRSDPYGDRSSMLANAEGDEDILF